MSQMDLDVARWEIQKNMIDLTVLPLSSDVGKRQSRNSTVQKVCQRRVWGR